VKKILNSVLYCLTDSEHSCGRDNIEVVSDMIEAGVKIIQYREKDKSMREKYLQCMKIRELTKKAGVTFIVNDHVDLAVITGADGVHIGQGDMPVFEVRKLLGHNKIIGLSTHSPEQVKQAEKDGVDYIGAGPVFETKTKKDVCEPVGLGYIDYVSKNTELPFVAIGGIKEHNVNDVIRHGAKCIAMVTEITGADNIVNKIKSINRTITLKG
jgi:thiamine-phosphate pyrophosphorylase